MEDQIATTDKVRNETYSNRKIVVKRQTSTPEKHGFADRFQKKAGHIKGPNSLKPVKEGKNNTSRCYLQVFLHCKGFTFKEGMKDYWHHHLFCPENTPALLSSLIL